MAGTKVGGVKTRETNIKRYGEDFYRNIGSAGGKAGTTGGFKYAKEHYTEDDPRHPVNAGTKGGKKSRRGTGRSRG